MNDDHTFTKFAPGAGPSTEPDVTDPELPEFVEATEGEQVQGLIKVYMDNVRLVQTGLADRLAQIVHQEGGPVIIHLEAMIATANIVAGLATDWLARVSAEDFKACREHTLNLIGRMAFAVNAIPEPSAERKAN